MYNTLRAMVRLVKMASQIKKYILIGPMILTQAWLERKHVIYAINFRLQLVVMQN